MELKSFMIGTLSAIVMATALLPGLAQPPASPVAEASFAQADRKNSESDPSPGEQAQTPGDLSLLFEKIWRVTEADSEPASGSIDVFLPNGTLLQTSCGEPYRIATWLVPDKDAPEVLQVTEDGEVAYTAEILELTSRTLRLRQRLVRSGETQEITLTAVEEEFVCPDLPR